MLHRFFLSQLKNPSHGDWVSSVLNILQDLSIELDLQEIRNIHKKKYKQLVIQRVKNQAFSYLLGKKNARVSENAKGRNIQYSELSMAEYLCPDIEISIEAKKWMFRCRLEDIEVKGNRRWKYSDLTCWSCDTNIEETQEHILQCEGLIRNSEIITYLPSHIELYNGNIDEQCYVAKILRDNFRRRVVPKQEVPFLPWTNSSLP